MIRFDRFSAMSEKFTFWQQKKLDIRVILGVK